MLEERTEVIDGQPIFWRRAALPGDADRAPVLYVHGVPTSSDDWLGFLERTGGIAPDLPGFGRSSKRGDLDYSIPGYVRFLEAFLDHLEVERVRMVVHDWGTVGLCFAQHAPERVQRLAAINVVPLLPGYRWHRIARVWRTPLLGELAMGASTRWGMRQLSRGSMATPGPAPAELIDAAWSHFDEGTQRAILKLYRSAPPRVLAEAGGRLGDVEAPALVLWGDRDPYIPARFADELAGALGSATVSHLAGAGHWPWLDQPSAIEQIVAFLDG